MHFRVTQLLLGMAIVAFYAAACAHPNGWWCHATVVLTTLLFAYSVRKTESHSRVVRGFFQGAVVGYVVDAIVWGCGLYPAYFDEWLFQRTIHDDGPPYFAAIVFSIMPIPFALACGALGAYWSKPQSPATKE